KITLLYRGIERIHIDMDDFPHIIYSLFSSVDGITIYSPSNISVLVYTFHHHTVATLTIGVIVFQLCLAILPRLYAGVPIDRCTDIIYRTPFGGVILGYVEF